MSDNRPIEENNTAILGIVLVISLILASIAASSPIAPTTIGNVVVLLITLFISIYYVNKYKKIETLSWALRPMVLIYTMIIISFIFSNNSAGIQLILNISYPIGFVFVSFVTLFLVPYIIPLPRFLYILNRIIITLIIIGIPEIIVGQSLLPYGRAPYAPINAIYEIEYRALTSIFNDSNAMGKLALFGFFTSIAEYKIRKNKYFSAIFLVMFLGLVLSDSRGAYIGVFAGITIYAIQSYTNIALSRIITLFVINTFFVLIVIISGYFPQIENTMNIRLSSRDVAWSAGINAIINNPWVGMPINDLRSEYLISLGGLSTPQNSYLRVFLISGFLGGISYIYFTLYVCYISLLEHTKNITILFPIPIAVIMMFETFSLFGTNINSIISAILFGYVIKIHYSQKTECRRPNIHLL